MMIEGEMEGWGWGVARSRMSEEWKKVTKGGRGGEGRVARSGEGRAARTKNPCSTERNFLLRERIFPAAGNKNYCCSNLWLLQQ